MLEQAQPSPSPAELEQFYRRRFAGALDYRRRVWEQLVAGFFRKWVRPDAAVLDLGCGYCEFINAIRAARKFGMDLNPDAARHAAPDVRILAQDCSEPWDIAAGSLDVVFTSNFFEHLPSKKHLDRTLDQAFAALRPDGLLVALGPNIRYAAGEYWDVYDHELALSDRSLLQAVRQRGFVSVKVIPRFLPFTMSEGQRYPVWMVRVYLLLPFVWPLFAKQFLVIARKPEN